MQQMEAISSYVGHFLCLSLLMFVTSYVCHFLLLAYLEVPRISDQKALVSNFALSVKSSYSLKYSNELTLPALQMMYVWIIFILPFFFSTYTNE
jgi:hypothetical protein